LPCRDRSRGARSSYDLWGLVNPTSPSRKNGTLGGRKQSCRFPHLGRRLCVSALAESAASQKFGLSRFLIPLQPQFPQAVHVLDNSGATSLLVLERLVDFRFAPLIALEQSLCDLTLIRIRLNNPFTSLRITVFRETQINAAKSKKFLYRLEGNSLKFYSRDVRTDT
jgi:hypothetical protein